jgi:hypothetical protein
MRDTLDEFEEKWVSYYAQTAGAAVQNLDLRRECEKLHGEMHDWLVERLNKIPSIESAWPFLYVLITYSMAREVAILSLKKMLQYNKKSFQKAARFTEIEMKLCELLVAREDELITKEKESNQESKTEKRGNK